MGEANIDIKWKGGKRKLKRRKREEGRQRRKEGGGKTEIN